MTKLRHIAMVVEDMEKTALFYERSFGMKRVRESRPPIMRAVCGTFLSTRPRRHSVSRRFDARRRLKYAAGRAHIQVSRFDCRPV